MFEAAGVSHDALSIASNEAPASASRNACERTAEQHLSDNFQEKDIHIMQNNVFLRLAQERYTTKHYNGQQIPRE